MTLEGAKKELKILREDYWDDDGYGHETKQYDDAMLALDIAINALQQQPCEDCINRSEAIKYLNTNMAWYDEDGEIADSDEKLKAITDLINGVPSAQPKTGHWIPVSEKLPEEFQRVLVTIVNYNGDKVVRVAEYYSQKDIFQIKENNEQWKVGEKGLLAWQPLPEPYEPQESEDKE